MKDFSVIANSKVITNTVEALKKNGINALVVENGEEAKKKVLEMIPAQAEVMQMTSVTLDEIRISYEINKSGRYDSVRNKLMSMNRKTESLAMQKIGAAPSYVVGSVQAVTEDGKVMIASNTGSQLAPYVYGSPHVIWVVGAQKIVKNTEEGMERIYKYILPKESVRLNKAYNISTGSFVSKVLIINREINPQRINLIFVKERLGY